MLTSVRLYRVRYTPRDKMAQCAACEGTGRAEYEILGGQDYAIEDCPVCHGDGLVHERCANCGVDLREEDEEICAACVEGLAAAE